ncbi:uncharacterized protein FPRO_07107 [Fusarium proliferatum ET1]|uniref:GATA-type domain-containing protein n=1 Tax=Fusarium proliferatum (strain ET1) TaxID=1227346 RepID=A0A1L7VBR9_FUSPR|nr:uncharacterized protein FPRO_07107 [Fusarium proliferatum ET1]CZR37702.1 uncharacterized protein FPRO_07107 [Fusarium proliferatum ET1]
MMRTAKTSPAPLSGAHPTNVFSLQQDDRGELDQFGQPLCEVPVFQTRTIPPALATGAEYDDISELQLHIKTCTRPVRSTAKSVNAVLPRSRISSKNHNKHGHHLARRSSAPGIAITPLPCTRTQQTLTPTNSGPYCTSCYAKETPKWREGPLGPLTLCNVCGLLYAKRRPRRGRFCCAEFRIGSFLDDEPQAL